MSIEIKTPRVERHFDHHSREFASNYSNELNEMAADFPVAYTPAWNGFWMLAGFEEVNAAADNWPVFSSAHDGIEGDPFVSRDLANLPEPLPFQRRGVSIPFSKLGTGVRFVPSECDPPMHTDIRRLEVPFFTPKAVRGHDEEVRRLVTEALDSVIETGSVELIMEFALQITTKVTIGIIGFDKADWLDFALAVHEMGARPGSQEAGRRVVETRKKLAALVAERAKEPKNDVASALLAGSIQGTPVSEAEAATILNGLTFAATDTTTSTLAHMMIYLSVNPTHRQRLIDDPTLIPNAIEEILRYNSPFFGTSRTVMNDIELGGQKLKAGDAVMLGFAPGNRDPRKFEEPETIKFDRANAKDHLAFGAGPHRCLGAPLARLELRIMIEEILKRIPDFHIATDDIVPYADKSFNGFESVRTTFTPGKRVSTS
ncbi:Cytochrome P450 [Variovorax sp. HW608]|uniref:cytochrome P450 n=1 Tax=Variovorax sp. HW608 TaxID=1034889 RepID=UPI00081FFBB4|nr:cytochrome P450 [Variovorax sp. HW608]SCK42709.1 Cytochrome P450 [Variovorax sp. HW608]